MVENKDIGNNMMLLDAMWFNYNIGLVAVRDTVTEETKFYIGVGAGVGETEDATSIAQQGSKLYPNHIKAFIDLNTKI